MKIKEMCTSQRPRERLLETGARSLSDAELIAILVGSGTSGESVLELSNRLLSAGNGSLERVADIVDGLRGEGSPKSRAFKGLGPARAARLSAAFELGRRAASESYGKPGMPITDASMIWKRMGPKLSHLDHEEFWVLFLNRSNVILAEEMLTSGNISSTTFDARAVVKKAMEKKGTTSVIVVHNHPSGNPQPSPQDIKNTDILHDALKYFDIALCDHIIIGRGRWFSFDEGRVMKGCPAALSDPDGGNRRQEWQTPEAAPREETAS